MVVAAVHRVVRHVVENVVHPAHVPLVVKAQATHRRRATDRGPGGGFFGIGGGARTFLAEYLVHAAQEMYSLKIFAAAEDVGDPFAMLATVIAIEHRSDGVDAQTVDPIVLNPEQRIADEIVENLASPEVVDQRTPVLMHAFARVGVFVKRVAVEATEAVLVTGEMRRYPVDDDFETRGVTRCDEVAETLG